MKIYWSIQNGGDGSAYPYFFTTKELAEWDQEKMDEGWGEPCVGTLTINGDFHSSPDVMDATSYWLLMIEDERYEPWEDREEFKSKFFPHGLPRFMVVDAGKYLIVYADNKRKHKYFKHEEETGPGPILEKRLNNG